MEILPIIVAVLISFVVAFFAGMAYRKKVAESKIQGAENEAKRLVEIAKKEAENLKKEEIFKAKEEVMSSRKELDQEIKERRGEIQKQEARLIQKEENLDKRAENYEKKEQDLEKEFQEVENRKGEVAKLYDEQLNKLQEIARLTQAEAKQQLLAEMEKEITTEKATLIRNLEQKAKEDANKNAKEILSYAIQKCAADHSQETTVSIVALPSDDIKGRIIGREGRNIKALETLTGVDLIIDDTPEAVVLSGFDPLRREVAKIALEKLIDDGRIHPSKIEEMVEKAKEEVEQTIKSEGERAALETGVTGLHPDVIKLLGKLKYRTSYGQNVLNHSIEVSNLARIMAEELGLDAKRARRAGLLHDIGKALDHDMEGTHVQIGVDILKKYKENPLVINAVEAHHGDVEPQTLEAVLVQAADGISASRPGARRETLEAYIKRLESLEAIADSFEGVEKSFAIQAGREVRIIVKPEKITDDQMTVLAREVSKRIENEMDYPGQIKVNIIRETRVIDYAK
ncbi:MAG: ribonuclease Y [Clostridia bacterium]|nr:ribonuclease Y [Clostridia bacterium]